MIFIRLKELAQLNENVKFIFADNENKNVLQFSNGLEMILMENIYHFGLRNRKPLNINFVQDDIEVSISMMYGFAPDVNLSYVNNLKTFDGGTHVQGLYDGIFCAFKKYIKNHIDKSLKITKKDIIRKLNFVISVSMKDPQFAGATKRELTNGNVELAIKNGIVKNLYKILQSNQSFLDDSRVVIWAERRKHKNK